jgi:capsular exopolysaccharide synthesis family protein
MERIREAIKRAKSKQSAEAAVPDRAALNGHAAPDYHAASRHEPEATEAIATVHVSRPLLEANRIIAHVPENRLAAPYDILRTKVAQEMDQQGWQVLVVTSPTAGCGKTVTSINLALSLARLPNRSVVLVDLDLRKPSVARYLGLNPAHDIASYLRGEATAADILTHIDVAGPQLSIIANKSSVGNPSEAIASQAMTDLMARLRTIGGKSLVVVDTPPLLTSDDVMALLPQADCCLMAVMENVTTLREIETSEELLASTNFLGCVLNKSAESYEMYY